MRTDRLRVEAGLRARGAAVVLVYGIALAGCSSSDVFGPSRPAPAPANQQPSVTDRMNDFFFAREGRGTTTSAATTALNAADTTCPGVDIRQGAATLSVGSTPNDPNPPPASLRYQASISQTARECAVLGATMTIKVGIQGRVILGPAGTPGDLGVPLRYAVVQEGTGGRTIVTKFHRIAVNIPPDQGSVPFVHVEEDLTFPLPRAAELDNYVIYVGFDPNTAPERPARPQKKKK